MSHKTRRACVVALCLSVAGCGRIGVFPVSDAPSAAPDGDTTPRELDEPMELDEQLDASSLMDAEIDPAESAVPVIDAGGRRDTGAALDADTVQVQDAGAAFDAAAAQDAGMSEEVGLPQDASPDAQDARSGPDAALDASLPACGGVTALNLCWYLGAMGDSCNQTCASHSGYDARTASTVGTAAQGGSLANCTQVLRALGFAGPVGAGMRPDGLGIGCHVWDSDGWWIETSDFSPTTTAGATPRIACACLK
jgi:predicted small lipoprotein YifL